MSLTNVQVDALLAPLDDRRVRSVQGNSHLEAWDVRRHLLRVFGWGGFDIDLLHVECILERSFWSEKPNEPFKGRHTVAYRVTMRLTIRDTAGGEVAHFEDGATGDAQNQPSLADAHDLALKTAMSQALKRCAVNLGDRFGLSLYDKHRQPGSAVVGKTLGNAHTSEHEASEAVTGGEMDEVPQGGEEREPASSGHQPPEQGGEADPAPAVDPPAPASPSAPDSGDAELLEAAMAALTLGKKRALRAWAVGNGMALNTTTGTPDTSKLDAGQIDQLSEYLVAINDPVPA